MRNKGEKTIRFVVHYGKDDDDIQCLQEEHRSGSEIYDSKEDRERYCERYDFSGKQDNSAIEFARVRAARASVIVVDGVVEVFRTVPVPLFVSVIGRIGVPGSREGADSAGGSSLCNERKIRLGQAISDDGAHPTGLSRSLWPRTQSEPLETTCSSWRGRRGSGKRRR